MRAARKPLLRANQGASRFQIRSTFSQRSGFCTETPRLVPKNTRLAISPASSGKRARVEAMRTPPQE
ncbi:hypothetical protein D3C80_2035510 [compost metagenome]